MKCIDRLVVNRWVITIALMFLPWVASATGQAGDQLIYQGDTLTLHTNPLEQYFQGKGERSINGESLPEWDVYYRKGQVYPMKWMVPVRFSEAPREKSGG